MPDQPRMYSEIAHWWHLLSAPENYAEEADFYRRTLEAVCAAAPRAVLELGSGGGNNASHLKRHWRMTLVDRSPDMLATSRQLNPDCEHVQGEMRNVRLGRTFDAVFVHDAVCYMTTETDLRSAMATAKSYQVVSPLLTVTLVAVAALGCGVADADTASRDDPAAEPEGHVVEPAVWTGTTTSGLAVTVRPHPFPVRVGETEFKIWFGGGVPDQTPISIDVVSPEMPAMGVLRYRAETVGPGEYVARARIGMGGAWEVYVNLGDYPMAISYYEQSLKIAHELGDRRGEGVILGNLGASHTIFGNYRRAIDYKERALKTARVIGDQKVEGTSLGNLGNVYVNLGDSRRAIDYIERALKISRVNGDRKGEGTKLPLIETPDAWVTTAEGEDLAQAARSAAEEMVALVQKRLGLSFEEAYMLMAAAVDVQICQCCEPGEFPVTTRAVISKEVMP